MVDVLTAGAALLVVVAFASYLHRWRPSGLDTRLGDGLFLVGVAVVLFADEVIAGRPLDVAVAVGAVLLVGGLGVKVVRPFTPERTE